MPVWVWGIGTSPTLPTDVPAEILAADVVSDPLPLFWFEPPFGPSLF
jgi:hypothetical protein